jgi:hypothetical protein
MEFRVKLILVESEKQEPLALSYLERNCTHVTKGYYIFEGEIDCLVDASVNFDLINEGFVGFLGDLTEDGLIEVCDEAFGVLINYKGDNPD